MFGRIDRYINSKMLITKIKCNGMPFFFPYKKFLGVICGLGFVYMAQNDWKYYWNNEDYPNPKNVKEMFWPTKSAYQRLVKLDANNIVHVPESKLDDGMFSELNRYYNYNLLEKILPQNRSDKLCKLAINDSVSDVKYANDTILTPEY